MDCWTSLKWKMEAALETGNVVEALSHLNGLITSASSPSDLYDVFGNHTVKDLPTLHYLARFPFQDKHTDYLFTFIGQLINYGYDINKTVDLCPSPRMTSFAITALLASIDHRNGILVDLLLDYGARPDIRDRNGFSPCHWAILRGDLRCLEKLTQVEGASVLESTCIEKGRKGDVHPLLHTAIDEGREEIVNFLLSKEKFGVDVNEEAIYRNVEYDDVFYKGRGIIMNFVDRAFTPLGRALYTGNTPIVEVLMKHPGIKVSRFRELHSLLEKGNTEKAFSLLKYFSDEELSTDKIQDRWAPHCIHPLAFTDAYFVEFTKKLILEYVRRGWDTNSVSDIKSYCLLPFLDKFEWSVFLTRYTLLHLACLYKSYEIIKVLVEVVGVDVNCKTEGEVELTPVQILLLLKEWGSAGYLIEKGADLNVRGRFGDGKRRQFTKLMRRNLTIGNLELHSTFNSVELLVRMGCEEGLPLLVQVLDRPDVVWQGSNEFHLALEGKNPFHIRKVAQRVAKIVSKEDLNWITLFDKRGRNHNKVPSLVWLLDNLEDKSTPLGDVHALADLIQFLAQLGYDLNSRLCLTSLPLLFYILRYDLRHRTCNLLLRTILQFDHLQLNVTDLKWLNPASYLLHEWNSGCLKGRRSICRLIQPLIVDAIQLLVTHGLDVSGMVIDIQYNFMYHQGSKLVLEMLHRAGAKIYRRFPNWISLYCHSCSREILDKEIAEFEEWKDEFNRETRLNLTRICRLPVRKILKCVGHLKMVNELPKHLKEDVLCTHAHL